MMRSARFLAGFFVAPLLLVLTSAFAEPEATLPAEPAASPTPPKDIMLVLDNSGSMKKNDPQFLMRKIVSAFADGLAPDSRLGLVLFDEKVHRVLGLTAADAPDFKDTIGASLKRLDYSGKLTDIPAGVERAIDELQQLGRPEAKRIIIFLTDGIVDLGNKTRDLEQARWLRENLAERAKALGIPIFGIALSKAADFQLIQSVAQVSGGDYYRVLAASDIPATLEQIRSRIEAAPAEPQKEPQPEPIAETIPPSEPIPAPAEPVAGTDPPPTTPESVSGWEKIPAEWRPWLLLAFGLIVLGIVGVVAVGRSRRGKPKKYPFIKHFKYSFIITAVGLIAAFLYGGPFGMLIAAILGVLEVSLSFDNAVVNASVLKDMEPKWQILFLTVGILIAVFGMRLLFPILIVSIIAQIGFTEVVRMALEAPDLYAQHLQAAHVQIAAFGGMFLLLVFLGFLLDEEKELHWLMPVEHWLARMGKLASVEVVLALTVLIVASYYLPEAERAGMFIAGISGIILYVLVDSVDALFETEEAGEAAKKTAKRTGFTGFLYLEVLDASFSFDGVIGAFAITKDVIIIMLGLMIGAIFVRSITVYLVRKGTLDEYVFLEHGAHYAIGALAFIMLATMVVHIPEAITGLIGVAFIGLAVYSSVRYRQQQASP